MGVFLAEIERAGHPLVVFEVSQADGFAPQAQLGPGADEVGGGLPQQQLLSGGIGVEADGVGVAGSGLLVAHREAVLQAALAQAQPAHFCVQLLRAHKLIEAVEGVVITHN